MEDLEATLYPAGVSGGHGGREEQEGCVQGWLQAGVQQATAGAWEQVGGAPRPPPGRGRARGGGLGGSWEPPLSPILACLSPKALSCKGKDVENVFTIRTPEDANRVMRLARGRNAVVVGAGFLGEQPGEPRAALAGAVQGASPPQPPLRPRDGGGRLPD